jgi:hypothetical protein
MKAREQQYLILGIVILMVLFAPPVRDALERSMTTQVLIELVGLAAAGWLLGMAIRRPLQRIMLIVNGNGTSGLVLGLLAMAFWMLPRTLDESLADPYLGAAKLVTVPLLVGAPLAISWPRLNPVLRGALKVKLIAMLFVLGWLYVAAPDRFCANYYQSDQALLGQLMIVIAGMLAVAWSLPCFIGGGLQSRARSIKTGAIKTRVSVARQAGT